MQRFILTSLIFLFPSPAFSWGETGHDIVARVAVRLVGERAPEALAKPFLKKEHMMGHLANVPDIVWRSMDKKVANLNGPTHFVDFEYLQANTSQIDPVRLPHDLNTYQEMLRSNCQAHKDDCAPGKSEAQKLSKTGTAPLRVGQLASLMRAALAEGKDAPRKPGKGGKDSRFEERINDALLYAGLLAHFVGDLTNPLHTAKDYDGWERRAGGLHEYFESDVVNACDLVLIHDVFVEARDQHPFEKAEAKYVPKAEDRRDAITSAWVLVADSQSHLKDLFELDRKASLLEDSKSKTHAKRKAPREARDAYQGFVTKRLALAADALATVWTREWEAAGKPDLSTYASFEYPVKPDFIVPVEGMGK